MDEKCDALLQAAKFAERVLSDLAGKTGDHFCRIAAGKLSSAIEGFEAGDVSPDVGASGQGERT